MKSVFRVPEIGEDYSQNNSLLQQNGLPRFDDITIENCVAAIGKQASDFEEGIKQIERHIEHETVKNVYKDIIEPMDTLGMSLDLTWGLSKTLYLGNTSVMPTKSYLAIHDRARSARAVKFNSPIIYNAVKGSIPTQQNQTDEQRRILKKFELEGKLNGLELDVAQKAHLEECLAKLSTEKAKFKSKIEYSTNLFKTEVKDKQMLKHFPVDLLKSMSVDLNNYFEGPFFVTLQPHVYSRFMECCPDRNHRWNVWQAVVNRGSGFSKNEYSTSTHIEEIRYLRKEQANILGYKNFVDMSMETKMASDVNNVRSVLNTLLEHAKPGQERELKDLYSFAIQRGFEGEQMELWDVPFWRKKQQLSIFNYKEEIIQEYFSLPTVLEGLFRLCEKLFNIVIRKRSDITTWAKDVAYYEVYEDINQQPIAGFYLDPYIGSDHKSRIIHNNGWMVGIQNGSRAANVNPLSALIFNFNAPANNKPCLLTFKDVNLLFHKFGHALQHMLSKTWYAEVSGLSNVEWDVVEVSGLVLTYLLHSKSVISEINRHYETQSKLSEETINSIISTQKHAPSLDLCRELYLSMLDLELHSTQDFWLDIVRKLWPQYRSFPLHKLDAHPCSFTQIFSQEWAAAYYSHVWARVIAADIVGAFYETEFDDSRLREVGNRYKETFLVSGGSCNPNKLFRKFRGRDPSPKALLSFLGIKQNDDNIH